MASHGSLGRSIGRVFARASGLQVAPAASILLGVCLLSPRGRCGSTYRKQVYYHAGHLIFRTKPLQHGQDPLLYAANFTLFILILHLMKVLSCDMQAFKVACSPSA